MTLEPEAAGYLLASEPGQRLYAAFLAGRSPDTLRAYTHDVAAFARFLGATAPSEAMTHLIASGAGNGNALLLAYRARMLEDGLAPATINRRLAAIRSAVKLARTLGMTSWSPDISGLRVDAYRDTAGPGLAGTRAMLAAAHAQRDRAKAVRDVALIRLMFDLGLRRGEVAALDVEDVDRSGRRILVKGKGRRQKTPRTLPGATQAAMEAWLGLRQRFAETGQAALFVSLARHSAGHRITGRGLHHLISHLGASVGLRTRPHGLRHASITAALDASNGDVRAVQQHARHTNPQTTLRYDDNRRDLAGQVATGLAGLLGALVPTADLSD
jgi:integrase/recombinase XerC